MVFKEEELHDKKEPKDKKEANTVKETTSATIESKQEKLLANVDPLISSKDSSATTLVEK